MFGVKTPQKHDFGGLNRLFKPNLQNFRIAIFRKVHTRSIRNLKEFFVHKWTSWVVQHYYCTYLHEISYVS